MVKAQVRSKHDYKDLENRTQRGDVTAACVDTERGIRGCHTDVYAHKIDNIDEIN